MKKNVSKSFYYVGVQDFYIKFGDGSSMLYNDVVCANNEKSAIELFCARHFVNKKNYKFVVFPIENAVFMHISNFGCFVFVSSDNSVGVIDMFKIERSSINYIQSICNYITAVNL